MKIVIIGGTGFIGKKLARSLRNLGYNILPASPDSGVNTVTGEGLDDALHNAGVVVDVTNSPSFADEDVMKFFQTSGRNLMAAEKKAGVKHHVAFSVVGTERLQQSGYFRAKQAQENIIQESRLPYTIIRSTQFFEFVGGIVRASTANNTIRVSPAFIQPIASDDVVSAMTDVVMGPPWNSIIEIAGPEKMRLVDLIKKYAEIMKLKEEVISDENAMYFGAKLNDQTLIPGASAIRGTLRYDEWINNSQNRL